MNWHKQETYKSMLSYGQSMLKYVFLINTGAILSIMTFIGSMHDPRMSAAMKVPLGWFVAGVIFAGLAGFTAYAVQFFLFNESDPDGIVATENPQHMKWLYATLFVVMASTICFAIGAFIAVDALGCVT